MPEIFNFIPDDITWLLDWAVGTQCLGGHADQTAAS